MAALRISLIISVLFLHQHVRCILAEKLSLSERREMVQASEEKKNRKLQELVQEKLAIVMASNPDGIWPFDEYSTCDKVKTIDEATPGIIKKSSSPSVMNTPECGTNMFMKNERREVQYGGKKRKKRNASRNQRTRAHPSDPDDSFLGHLERLMEKAKGRANELNSKKVRTKTNRSPEFAEEEIEARIVGGTESVEGKFPWMVTIGKKNEGFSCGGTLLNDRWVITAAHCFQPREALCTYNIRVGSFNWLNDETGHHIDIEPELVVRNKDFSMGRMDNDIAMVKLSKPVPLSPNSFINNICFPENGTAPGTPCVAAGWGTEQENADVVPSTLREVDLEILPRNKCSFSVSERQFCASYTPCCHDTCQGDSGGPLMTKKGDKWYIVGVTSFGYGCGRAEWPGIYTDVYSQREFISSVLNRY